MNYYEKHIGDWVKDTIGLSMLEEGAYSRLIDQIYQTERPLPTDLEKVFRLARATTTVERKAVEYVLESYFTATDDGYIQKRCQVEIERYWERDQSNESKRENDRERQQRARERRKTLFEQLRSHGIVPEFNTPTKQLALELSRVTPRDEQRDDHNTVTRDNTANQTPDTNPHTPDTNKGKNKSPAQDADLPDWLPVDAWSDFVDMRKKIKAPLTDAAKRLAINSLEKLMQDGQRPRAVLEQSVMNSWKGLFEVKAQQRGNGQPLDRDAYNERENAKAKELLFGPEANHAV